MQYKKITMQSSTFSLPCSVQLIISLKIFIRFNWESNKFEVFTHFTNIEGKIDNFNDIGENCELPQT